MRRLPTCALILTPVLLVAQMTGQSSPADCKPLLRFQLLERPTFHTAVVDPDKLLYQVGRSTVQPLAVRRLMPARGAQETLSVLVMVWPGGLSSGGAAQLAKDFGRDDHWRVNLAVLTPGQTATTWSEDAARQADMLRAASVGLGGVLSTSASSQFVANPTQAAAAAPTGQSVTPAGSTAAAGQSQWLGAIRTAMRQLRQQPGARVVVEVLPPPVGLPSAYAAAPSPGPFSGEAEVRSQASLLPTPVYRVLNSGPALPYDRLDHRGFAAYGDTWQNAGREVRVRETPLGSGLENKINNQENWIQQTAPILPPTYPLFTALGGVDVWSTKDLMPTVLADVKRMYLVTLPTPAPCRSNQLIPMRVQAAGQTALPLLYFPAYLYSPAIGADAPAEQAGANTPAQAATAP